MLINVGRRPVETAPPGVVELLNDCHRRIRHFTSLAAALATPVEATPEEIARAAASVHRYFTMALPKHSADEDESIAPRLRALGAPAAVREALDTVAAQHETLHAVLDALAPHWTALASDPASVTAHGPIMDRLVAQLRGIWASHLVLEERVVFPAITRLIDPAAQADILREMRARRGNPS